MLVDDSNGTGISTIMSKLDITGGAAGVRVNVNPEVKLRAVIEITANLRKSLAVDLVLPKLLDSLFKIFVQADRGFVVLRGANPGQLVIKAVKQRRSDSEDMIRISRTIINQVLDTKQAILSADAAADARFEMSQSIADFRIRSMMCAPLVNSDGDAMGAIQIDTIDQRARFQQDDLDVLAGVANQAAFALENAQLHEQALKQQGLQRDLELAHKVQQGLLPARSPKFEGYHFFDFYEPANQVGGDFYDYIRLPGGRLAIVLADVSGKGVAAALVMARISSRSALLPGQRAGGGRSGQPDQRRLLPSGLGRSIRDVRARRPRSPTPGSHAGQCRPHAPAVAAAQRRGRADRRQ